MGFFPPQGEPLEIEYSRYAGELMLLYAAGYLGCIKAATALDVTQEGDRHSHQRRYLANFLAIASGKQRLSHVDELIPDEFEQVCGGHYPRKSSNYFKERKKWGSDKFCGGLFKKIKALPPSKAELSSMKKKLSFLDKKIPKCRQELESYEALLKEGKLTKRDYNRLAGKAQKDIENYSIQREVLKAKFELGQQGFPLDEEPRHELDTRKMAVLAILQEHVIASRRFILSLLS